MKTKISTSAFVMFVAINCQALYCQDNKIIDKVIVQEGSNNNVDTTYFSELLKQINYYDTQAEKLWNDAKNKKGAVKEMMMEKEISLREQSLMKQMEASALSANANFTISDSFSSSKRYSACTEALLKQANYYDSLAEQLKVEATNKQEVTKEFMMEKVADLHQEAISKQIEASKLISKIVRVEFYQNMNSIDSLINKIVEDGLSLSDTKNTNSQAEMYLKRAEEMREEANAWDNNDAKLGSLINAEEQENLALKKQKELINGLLFTIPSEL